MKLQETHKYDDIIHLSRPKSERHPPMSAHDRAGQFSPFAALTDFDAAIEETGRLTDSRMELDEGGLERLDEQMHALLEVIQTQPKAEIVWFCYDERKAGGSYVTTVGHVKKVDTYSQKLLFTHGQVIPLGEIFSIQIIPGT